MANSNLEKLLVPLTQSSQTSVAQIAWQAGLTNASTNIPILGKVISVSAAVQDAIISQQWSNNVTALLKGLIEQADKFDENLHNLTQSQMDILGLTLNNDCRHYDSTITTFKKRMFATVLANHVNHPENITLDGDELQTYLIQTLPEFSINFLYDMYTTFDTKEKGGLVINPSSDQDNQEWYHFYTSWIKDASKGLAFSLDISSILGPLISTGLIAQRYVAVIGSDSLVYYHVTYLGQNFLDSLMQSR